MVPRRRKGRLDSEEREDMAAKEAERRNVVGYHREKGAQTFALGPDEELPAGFRDKPYPGQHPNDADNKHAAEAPKRRRKDDDDDDEGNETGAQQGAEGSGEPGETPGGRKHHTAHK
jgi:hypothetical protein